jgi:hypothetical protein
VEELLEKRLQKYLALGRFQEEALPGPRRDS